MKNTDKLTQIKNLSAAIRQKQLFPVYLFCGEEEYFVHEARKETLQAIKSIQPGAAEIVIEGDSASPQEIMKIIRSPSLFNPFQIIVVRDVKWFDAGKKIPTDDIKDWIVSQSRQAVLVLTALSVDKRLTLVKLVKKHGAILDFPKSRNFNQYEPNTDEYYSIVKERLSIWNQTIETAAWKQLRLLTSDSLWAVINAVDVVSSYVGSHPRITVEDVNKCISDNSDVPGYVVVQAMGDRDAAKMKAAITKTMTEGTHPLSLSKSISIRVRSLLVILSIGLDKVQLPSHYFHFRDNLLPQILIDIQGHPVANEILASMNPYALFQLLQQSKRFNQAELTACLNVLARIDKSLKSGQTQAQGLFELALYPLCRLTRNRT